MENNYLLMPEPYCHFHGARLSGVDNCSCFRSWEGQNCQTCKCDGGLCSSVGYCCNPQNSTLKPKSAHGFQTCRCKDGFGGPTCNKRQVFLTNKEVAKMLKPFPRFFSNELKTTKFSVECMSDVAPDGVINDFKSPIVAISLKFDAHNALHNPLKAEDSVMFIHGKHVYSAEVVNPQFLERHHQRFVLVCWIKEVMKLPIDSPNDMCFVSNIFYS